ncbi:pentatricopeptide repeat-containing protein At5g15010, mitochondrial-like [Cornus florida]|uniref:pentatricopeptide repeat-containing protein At5g15010, mitochondrial-like n=1 Tax=Cornus florida TaxID=4283 RepID=UPI00289D399F|nr:pentatricopeptide repeat-containing protein At5g15010, mitochondrial-like [Cornus florida]XP_059647281.1 pentatricopeptide repeat-containing protein At5g15010, mitochondrial-like [Cornus florida]XP_059647282.1 pentatricopeptide repeat-containing protein At5g15010, mitochondrial-like [Cornus florida]
MRRRFTQSLFSLTQLNSTRTQPSLCQSVNPLTPSELSSSGTYIRRSSLRPSDFPFFFSSFTLSVDKNPRRLPTVESDGNSDNDDDNDGEGDDNDPDGQLDSRDPIIAGDVGTILGILREKGSGGAQVKSKLEQCGVTASSELVDEVLSRVRNDWEAAFTFFLWAGKQPGYAHSLREYHSMIAILGKMRKFDTAWALIDEMRGGKTGPSLVTPQTLLIMIRRYCAVHDVGKAVNAFYAHKKFKFEVGMEEFQQFLSALCRYKNVKDAEHLLFCNKNVFPFNTKSFNIILNGYCNIVGDQREAKRIWREMIERRIPRDVISYSSIMSCYSKASNLNAVFKLFDQMKAMDITPDRKVYNAVIHALAKGRFVKEARNLMKTMEEKGIAPNAVTYNSLIKPLCKARRLDDAGEVFHEMLERDLSPTIRTYHAFFRILRTGEQVFELLEKMYKMGCCPNNDTYIMLIRKFCRWRQLDNVIKLWTEMSKNGLDPDRSSYTVLIHGLFLNGKLEEAYKYYQEMKEKQFLPEPKTDEMLQAWVSSKEIAEWRVVDSEKNQVDCSHSGNRTTVNSKKFNEERDFRRQPETRRVVRERGFSFWDP